MSQYDPRPNIGPEPTALDCGHSAVTFGCSSCIQKQRAEWIKKSLAEFSMKDHGKCRRCKSPRKVWEGYMKNGKLVAIIGCSRFDEKRGEGCNQDEDKEVVVG